MLSVAKLDISKRLLSPDYVYRLCSILDLRFHQGSPLGPVYDCSSQFQFYFSLFGYYHILKWMLLDFIC